MSYEPGQMLEDIKIYPSKYGSHVFATLVEDLELVDLDAPDTHLSIQECDTLCPSCREPITLRLIAVSCVTGQRHLMLLCSDCSLLFRSVVVGTVDWQGEYTPTKEYE